MPQDPAVIQQQIENTRAELAETVDAIAEMVSPKRVANRAAAGVKERIELIKDRVRETGGGHRDQQALPAGAGDGPVLAAAEGPAVGRAVRWDRVGAVGGILLLLAVLTAWRRHSAD